MLEMDILKILDRIKNTPDCIVYSPCGLPILNKEIKIPDDLKVFYEKAKAEDETSIVTKDLDAFINGHAYGYGTRFCLLRYGR